MNPFEQLLTGAKSELVSLGVAQMFPRMLAAVIIGAVLATRPWRWLMRKPLPKAEMIQAQVLLCTAAAVITVVIGDSVAKAFGLVGLGGFVRFRSGLKDPRDAAILFLMIGLGMACGHGALELAAVGTAFVAVLLAVLDLFSRKEPEPTQRVKLQAASDDPAGDEDALRRVLTARNVLVRGSALDLGKNRLELELEECAPGAIAAALGELKRPSLRELRWATVQPGGKHQKEELA